MRQLLFVSVLSIFLTACGGGGGTPTPTGPAPIASVDTCSALDGIPSTSGASILNGSGCSPDGSSILLLNLRTADGRGLGQCSGTVVAPRIVLTAAHCLDADPDPVGLVRVWPGTGEEIVADSFVFYPGYRFNASGFDVGVVMLPGDLPRSSVPILTSRDARVGETAIIAGWGRDENSSAATLHAGSTTLSAVASGLLQTLFAPPSSSVCSGDSGGPILVREGDAWAIAGITSATSDNVCNTGTNFYQAVRHPSVRDFILQHVPGIGQR